MYHPLPALVPHVLAPASPASTAANPSTLNLDLATKRLAALDAPRRKFGLSYAVPPRLGLPQLICTGVNGIWSASAAAEDDNLSGDEHPPWVRAGQARDGEQENGSDDPYRKGLPRDEEEAEAWAEARRQKRRQAKATDKVQRTVDDDVRAVGPIASSSNSSLTRETAAGADVPIRKTRGEAHLSASKAAAAPKLVTSHFTATKATVAAAHTKKRPAGSPPPPGTAATGPSRSGPRSSAATGRASKRSPSPAAERKAADGGSNTKGVPRAAPTGSAATTQVVGETETFDPFVAEEVLFERGCTQMELPDPTASTRPPPSSASAHLPRATPTERPSSAAHTFAPFSSPGLMNNNGSDSGTMLLDTGLISTPRPPLAGTESGGKRESQKQQPPPPPPPHLPSPNSLPVTFPDTERPAAAAAARRPGPSRAATADSVTSGITPSAAAAAAAIARKSLTRLDSPSTTGSGDGRLVETAAVAEGGFTTDSLERERELGEIEDFLIHNVSG